MKKANPIYESSALLNDKSITTSSQCEQVVVFIKSNLPVNEIGFTNGVKQ